MKDALFGRFTLVMFILCAVTTLGPSTAMAQAYADLVWTQLQAVHNLADQDGYSTQNYIIGKINEGQSDTWTLTFYGGNSYVVLAACDGDCQDIDIRLYDENGNEIDSDTSEDDVPTLEGTVETTARFTIEVEMFSCNAEPCYYGLGIFYR